MIHSVCAWNCRYNLNYFEAQIAENFLRRNSTMVLKMIVNSTLTWDR